jgi:hypothetical protein
MTPCHAEPSPVDRRDALPSRGSAGDALPLEPSPQASGDACRWCLGELPAGVRCDSRFCSKRCRQTAWRARRGGRIAAAEARPMRVAYADPPYPGFAHRMYKRAEVDHAALIAQLEQYDGWALSTSAAALRTVLPLCPAGVRVCAWVKPISANPATWGIHNTWEPLVVLPARRLRPGKRDWLAAQPARRGGTLAGRKPLAFCRWLFALLGMRAGDELADLFPGTGVVGRAWRELSAAAAGDGSRNGAAAATATAQPSPRI